ncbi:MAG: hypothetical protein M3N51_02110 [Actinomycetota bacterium]|nr:hypothetical protein [Actinomycetota bacterium]
MESEWVHDPYEGCEDRCGHELVRGVTIAELLRGDGPYPTIPLIVAEPDEPPRVLRSPVAPRPPLAASG